MKRLLLAAVLAAFASASHAATYYVRKDGIDTASGLNDTNNATTGAWLTIQKAADTMVAGDTVIVGDGVYSDIGATLQNVREVTSGSSSNWITFRSKRKWGAVIQGGASAAYGFSLSGGASYIRIEDFDITGQQASVSNGAAGARTEGAGSNIVFSGNRFHDIGRQCVGSVFGITGWYSDTTSNVTFQNNVFENIGRFGPDETTSCWPAYVGGTSYPAGAQVTHSGTRYRTPTACNSCANTPPAAPWVVDDTFMNRDHAIYFGDTDNLTVKGNLFFNGVWRGWPVQAYGGGAGAATGFVFSRNYVIGSNPNREGHLEIARSMTGAVVEGNVFIGAKGNEIFYSYTEGTSTSCVFRNNIMWNGQGVTVVPGPAPAGWTTTGNFNIDPGAHLPAVSVRP
jgi:hypothetical protein